MATMVQKISQAEKNYIKILHFALRVYDCNWPHLAALIDD